jgi:hypothetical protein
MATPCKNINNYLKNSTDENAVLFIFIESAKGAVKIFSATYPLANHDFIWT